MKIERGERWKTWACFALFGCVAVAVTLRLGWLQLHRAEANRRSVERSRDLHDALPAPRGTIVDRHGRPLAYDRPVLTVRAEFHGRVAKGVARIPDGIIDYLAARLANHLLADEQRADRHDPAVRAALRDRLRARIVAGRHVRLSSNHKTRDYLKVDFLLARHLDSQVVVTRLREEARHWRQSPEMPGRLHLRLVRSYKRTYPERAVTMGPVGSYYVGDAGREGFTGLESCRGLWPSRIAAAAARRPYYSLDFKDARRRRYWAGLGREPGAPSTLYATLDLELQKVAHAELRAASAAVRERYQSDYEWGAMVLVDVPTGDVLALASHYPGRQGATPFAAVENSFEPGSVVKPLVIAWAMERGRVGWEESIDCAPTRPKRGRPVDGWPRHRVIYDDHACGELTPHGILVNSSNIGAVRIGTRLDRGEMIAYMRQFGFDRKTDLGIPGEVAVVRRGGVASIGRLSDRQFGAYTAPSLSFGYELNVTAVQLARAYLTLLSGRQRELRLIAGARIDGADLPAPPAAQGAARFLSVDTVERIKGALRDVVSADEHATGRHLHKLLDQLGHPQPLIAGKTGTSDSGIGGVRAKTAAFVGFAPHDAPRYLAVCVLRKVGAAKFYGGSYAAPSAGRLLLAALAAEQRRDQRPRAEQVSAWTGGRGSSSNR